MAANNDQISSTVIRNGFTLVELMVVVFVMGLLAGAVVLTMDPGGRDAAEQASRFASRVAAARDEAVTNSAPVRVWISASGYGFERYANRSWTPIAERGMQPTDWSDGTGIAIVEGASGGQARIAFDTIGMPGQPFAVTLTSGEAQSTVSVAANGDVAVR